MPSSRSGGQLPFLDHLAADSARLREVLATAPAGVRVPTAEVVWITAPVGCGAVPVSVAVSVIGFPSTTVGPAVVVRVGVTGLITKHSPVDVSLDPVYPAVGLPV